VLSAGIGVFRVDGFQGGDDTFEVVGDLLMVGGQAAVAAGLGEVDELQGVVDLFQRLCRT